MALLQVRKALLYLTDRRAFGLDHVDHRV
jgi:hypothetical protein